MFEVSLPEMSMSTIYAFYRFKTMKNNDENKMLFIQDIQKDEKTEISDRF